MSLGVGQIVVHGKYRIIERIASGGMANVWRAEELTFGRRQVAIKEPPLNLGPADQAELVLRFHKEVEIYAALQQAGAPHVVPAYTTEEHEGRPLLVMAYVRGGDLRGVLRQHPQGLPVSQAVSIARAILQALAVAHNHRLEIVHSDVTPANILFDEKGAAYLSDFGAAQMVGGTQRTQLLGSVRYGTPGYMAPEQASGAGYLTPACDVYAVGAVLFEMLTGQRYRDVAPGTSVKSLRPLVPETLSAVVEQALLSDPYDRFVTATAMLTAIDSVSGATPNAGRKWGILVSGLLLVGLLAGVGVALNQSFWVNTPVLVPSAPIPPTSQLTEVQSDDSLATKIAEPTIMAARPDAINTQTLPATSIPPTATSTPPVATSTPLSTLSMPVDRSDEDDEVAVQTFLLPTEQYVTGTLTISEVVNLAAPVAVSAEQTVVALLPITGSTVLSVALDAPLAIEPQVQVAKLAVNGMVKPLDSDLYGDDEIEIAGTAQLTSTYEGDGFVRLAFEMPLDAAMLDLDAGAFTNTGQIPVTATLRMAETLQISATLPVENDVVVADLTQSAESLTILQSADLPESLVPQLPQLIAAELRLEYPQSTGEVVSATLPVSLTLMPSGEDAFAITLNDGELQGIVSYALPDPAIALVVARDQVAIEWPLTEDELSLYDWIDDERTDKSTWRGFEVMVDRVVVPEDSWIVVLADYSPYSLGWEMVSPQGTSGFEGIVVKIAVPPSITTTQLIMQAYKNDGPDPSKYEPQRDTPYSADDRSKTRREIAVQLEEIQSASPPILSGAPPLNLQHESNLPDSSAITVTSQVLLPQGAWTPEDLATYDWVDEEIADKGAWRRYVVHIDAVQSQTDGWLVIVSDFAPYILGWIWVGAGNVSDIEVPIAVPLGPSAAILRAQLTPIEGARPEAFTPSQLGSNYTGAATEFAVELK